MQSFKSTDDICQLCCISSYWDMNYVSWISGNLHPKECCIFFKIDDHFQLSLLKGSSGEASCRSFFFTFSILLVSKKPTAPWKSQLHWMIPITEAKHKIRKSQSILTKMLKVLSRGDNRKALLNGIIQCKHR